MHASSPWFRLCLLCLALSLYGCSSTKITDHWVSPESPPKAKRVLLVSLIKDPVTRRYFEEHFVAAAKKHNLDVIASSDYTPNPTDLDEKQEVLDLVQKTRAEGVLVAQIQGVQKRYRYVPSRLDWYPDAFSSLHFYDYFFQSYRAIYRPGYVGSDSFFHMQFRYFSTANEKLAWAANVRTRNPRSLVGTIEQIADEVISSLRSAGLI